MLQAHVVHFWISRSAFLFLFHNFQINCPFKYCRFGEAFEMGMDYLCLMCMWLPQSICHEHVHLYSYWKESEKKNIPMNERKIMHELLLYFSALQDDWTGFVCFDSILSSGSWYIFFLIVISISRVIRVVYAQWFCYCFTFPSFFRECVCSLVCSLPKLVNGMQWKMHNLKIFNLTSLAIIS